MKWSDNKDIYVLDFSDYINAMKDLFALHWHVGPIAINFYHLHPCPTTSEPLDTAAHNLSQKRKKKTVAAIGGQIPQRLSPWPCPSFPRSCDITSGRERSPCLTSLGASTTTKCHSCSMPMMLCASGSGGCAALSRTGEAVKSLYLS